MLRGVIWDFDGTICDTYPAIASAVNAALAQFGRSASLDHIIELSSVSLDHCIHTLADELAVSYVQLDQVFGTTYRAIQPHDQPPFPGVAELCQALAKNGVLQFIVTHRRRASLTVLLQTHNLLSLFEAIIAADDGFPKKPAPDALLHLLNTYTIAPQDALVIGDRDLDVLAGQAAGVPTCLFRSSFPSLTASRTIQRFDELADLISENTSSTADARSIHTSIRV